MDNNTDKNVNSSNIGNKRKGHGPIYWIIVIVGVAFIVAASFNLGTKFGKMVEGNDNKTNNDSNEVSNSNQTSNIDSNITSNNSNITTLSNDDALKIGNDLYTKAKDTYSDKMNQDSCGNSVNVDGEQLVDCTALYNNLLNIYATDNKAARSSISSADNIFSSFINKNGKYYLVPSGGAYNGEATTTLTITKIEENKITFAAKSVISKYNEQGQLVVDGTVTDDFIIIKENNAWKVSYFITQGV